MRVAHLGLLAVLVASCDEPAATPAPDADVREASPSAAPESQELAQSGLIYKEAFERAKKTINIDNAAQHLDALEQAIDAERRRQDSVDDERAP